MAFETPELATARAHVPVAEPLATVPLPAGTDRFARLAAASGDPVLVHGETGSGKTWLARQIHALGPCARGSFVHVNCAAVPEGLFEREMFGHVRGAFTDARESRPGLVEEADGGTLFLDELGELPLTVQPKLLQVIEERTVRRLGATRATPARFRLVAATNRDLERMVEEGRFREDLYYRCAVLEHRVPPLRERRRELPGIIECLLARVTATGGVRPEVSAGALRALCAHPWPGNLRELENCLRQAVAYAAGECIEIGHLPERVLRARPAPSAAGAPAGRVYVAPPDEGEEIRLIRDALRAEGGNKTRAARRLGMSRATLWIKLQRHAPLLDAPAAAEPEEEEDGGDAWRLAAPFPLSLS